MLCLTRAVTAWSQTRLLTRFAPSLTSTDDMVAPFLAPTSEERTRNYYLGIMLTKYATCVASGTLLYHMHLCFSWKSGILGTAEEDNTAAVNLLTGSWWIGRMSLLAISLFLQKLPSVLVGFCFRWAAKRRAKTAKRLQDVSQTSAVVGSDGDAAAPRRKMAGTRCAHTWYVVMPWMILVATVATSFGLTLVLTSRGFLSAEKEDEAGVPCTCRGIGGVSDANKGEGSDNAVQDGATIGDWLALIFTIVGFRALVWRPLYIMVAVVSHRRLARRTLKRYDQIGLEGGEGAHGVDAGAEPDTSGCRTGAGGNRVKAVEMNDQSGQVVRLRTAHSADLGALERADSMYGTLHLDVSLEGKDAEQNNQEEDSHVHVSREGKDDVEATGGGKQLSTRGAQKLGVQKQQYREGFSKTDEFDRRKGKQSRKKIISWNPAPDDRAVLAEQIRVSDSAKCDDQRDISMFVNPLHARQSASSSVSSCNSPKRGASNDEKG